MTEKRFKYTFEGIEDTFETDEEYKYAPCTKDGFQDLCELLNELHEEIEYLKPLANENSKYIDDMEDDIITFKQKAERLEKENEQLKQEDELFFGKVFDILLKYQDLFNREMADEVLEELGIELTRWFE